MGTKSGQSSLPKGRVRHGAGRWAGLWFRWGVLDRLDLTLNHSRTHPGARRARLTSRPPLRSSRSSLQRVGLGHN